MPDTSLTLSNGNTVRILTSGKQTGGKLTVIDYVDRTTGNPPPFTRHEFIEVFTVLEGKLAFQYQGEDPFVVTAGISETVAAGRSHTFWNPAEEPLHILLACTPAGLDSFFQDIHLEMDQLNNSAADDSQRTECMARLRVRYGIEETAPAPDIKEFNL